MTAFLTVLACGVLAVAGFIVICVIVYHQDAKLPCWEGKTFREHIGSPEHQAHEAGAAISQIVFRGPEPR
jgi:hypothetical protein